MMLRIKGCISGHISPIYDRPVLPRSHFPTHSPPTFPPKRYQTSHINAGGGYISHAHKEYKNRLGDQIVVFWGGGLLGGKGSYKRGVYKWEGGSHINTSVASKHLFSGKTHRRAEDAVAKREATDDVSSGIADLRMRNPCGEGAMCKW